MNVFHYARKPTHTTTKSTLFAVSKDELNTEEDTGKSINCTYCSVPKGTSQPEAGKKNLVHTLTHCSVTLV